MINQDIVEGKLKEAEGKVEDAYGDLTNNPEHDVRGKLKQAEGLAQQTVGHAKEAIADDVKKTDREIDAEAKGAAVVR